MSNFKLFKKTNFAKFIDQTNLNPLCSQNEMIKFLTESKKYDFASVCIFPCWTKLARYIVKDKIKICNVIGFPLGMNDGVIKYEETRMAIRDGAKEIDMVINFGMVKSKQWVGLGNEVELVKDACKDKILKVIIEMSKLDKDEIKKVVEVVCNTKADYIKTSTGVNVRATTTADVKLLYKLIKGKKLIKASGGIKTYQDAVNLLTVGADRIGTSAGITIMKEQQGNV